MSAALLDRIEAAGVRLQLDGDHLNWCARESPSLELLATLRANRNDLVFQLRVRFYRYASESALAALQAPSLPPPPGEVDHDAGEREAMAAQYAAAADLTLPDIEACFPCGRAVPPGTRQWSAARGWCCAACHPEGEP